MLVSTTDYRDATRAAMVLVVVIYGLAGLLLGISMRRLNMNGHDFVYGLIAAILLGNAAVALLRRIRLPKVENDLRVAIQARDGAAFGKHIIRREMTRLMQPLGGISLSIGLVATVIALRALGY